ncbi:MAG: GIY-YIG nuclease family protein [Pseudanabaenaceae cyanobacterium bins.68]|nr:GIY-YIG nuclease family protein [Pseudanabaenaceae cyanobacterium bins.68]
MSIFILPAKSVNHLEELPKAPGIYYITACWMVFYVGKSQNLRRRWQSHHRLRQFIGLQPFGRLHYRLMPLEQIHAYELAEIERLKPAWNYQQSLSWWQSLLLIVKLWLVALGWLLWALLIFGGTITLIWG